MVKIFILNSLKIYYLVLCGLRKHFQYIHVLSHPRSGSTLLSHILINNPDITGIGETKLTYSKANDLKELPINVALVMRKFPFLGNEKYILDKLIYNHLIDNTDVATIYGKNTSVIFLLRDPMEALNSLSRLDWITKKDNPTQYVVDLYLNRIKMLKRYNKQLESSKCERRVLLTYSQLLNQTRESFRILEELLKLTTPLSESYSSIRTTGNWRYGDSSEEIESGTIVRQSSTHKPKLLNFDDYIDQVYNVYENCLQDLARTCLSVAS